MRKHIRVLEFITAACLLAVVFVAPLANAGTIVVGAPVGATADTVARHLGRNLGGSYIILNKSGFDATSAAREMRGKATDGSELMIVQMNEEGALAGKSPHASEYASLTPVAMLGDIQSTAGKLWFGLFAPPGTPASVVSSLNARVRQLMASVPESRTTSTVQYAQDMSPGALSQRLAAAGRAQATTTAAPTPAASARPSQASAGSSKLGATTEQDCLDEYQRLGMAGVQQTYYSRTGGSHDRLFEILVDNKFGGATGEAAARNPRPENFQDVEWLKRQAGNARGRDPRGISELTWIACKMEARAERLQGRTNTARVDPPGTRVTTATPAPSATPSVTPARPASSGSAGAANPGTAPPAAPNRAQAQQRQAALDEQRRGKTKRHYAEREAHHCLTLWKEKTMFGGFTNTCDFPVTFIYCAYKPKKGAWTESFNCEGKTPHVGGNAVIQPHDRSSHHTLGAQKILWFACRSDSTKEEIFEVGDGEFDPTGPFIRARCVKWGDRS